MNDQVRGGLQQRIGAAISRRDSLLSFGAGALAAVAQPALTASGKGKNARNKKIKLKKCKKQVEQCTTFLTGACLGDPVCQSAITCCGLLKNCNAAAALPCIFIN